MSYHSISFHCWGDHALHESLLQLACLGFDSQVLLDRLFICCLELVQVPLHLNLTQLHEIEFVLFFLLLKCSHAFSYYRLFDRLDKLGVGLGDLYCEILQIRVRYDLGCSEVLVRRRI